MRLERENVGGSRKIRSYSWLRGSLSHFNTSAWINSCFGPCTPFNSRLRRAQSRYVHDMSTVVVERAPPSAACAVALPV